MTVDELPIQVFWDVNNCLFKSRGTGHGLFIFKPGEADYESDRDGSGRGENTTAMLGAGTIWHNLDSPARTSVPSGMRGRSTERFKRHSID